MKKATADAKKAVANDPENGNRKNPPKSLDSS